MIKPKSISGFYENLPEAQIIEDNFKEIIRKNYSLSGFTPLDTPNIERVETLTSKGADDNEIYGIKRLKAEGEEKNDFELGLRFDLTVPLARYVAQYEGELDFPFKRQHIAKVYRGERPQKGRYREFYQADVDIIGNAKLSLFADVEILSTIYNSLKELNFGDFVININNKKLLVGFLESIDVENIVKTISIIDKKDKVKSIVPMLEELGLKTEQISEILTYVNLSEIRTSMEILEYFSNMQNDTLLEGLGELKYLYENLINLGVDESFIKLNPSISRGLNYYTGTVFETFILGAEEMGSIASGGRYENLTSNFCKNNYPGVGGSIGLSRLISVLNNIGKIELGAKTVSKVLVLNMGEEYLTNNLQIVKTLRNIGINTEIYLDSETKLQKQIKYADNKKIPFVIIQGEDEIEKGVIQLKNLEKGEQIEVKIKDLEKKLLEILL
ncbi:MAG: histidine--tRNA ligase [Candidatus Gracilibacteria bacterium]|nr:histidine--tRNA ligase [Candidatus Gracilibacteria bacterium]